MTKSSIEEIVQELQAYIPQEKVQRYTLDRIIELLAVLGNPQEDFKTIHVAGTSGKTSTSYFLRGLLIASGVHVGLTISPHIDSITERIQIDGAPITDELFVRYAHEVLAIVRTHNLWPSYFEIMIALAFYVFSKEKVQYAVVEVGLGGLIDGTNTIRRQDKICVISDIGLDHTEVLGNTIEEIATQKAGIIQASNSVVLQAQPPAATAVVVAKAAQVGAQLSIVDNTSESEYTASLPSFQRHNFRLALAGYEVARLREGWPLPRLSEQQLIDMQPPGRMEIHEINGKRLILDGAHNPQKLGALGEALRERGWTDVVVLGSAVQAPEEKLDQMFEALATIAQRIIVTEFSVVQDIGKVSPAASVNAARAKHAGFADVQIEPELSLALDRLLASEEATLLVTGSLYLVAQVRAILKLC